VRTRARTVVDEGTLRADGKLITGAPARFKDRVARGPVRHVLDLGAVAIVTIALASAFVATRAAEAALPLCGGNQASHAAPRSCTNTRVIDGTAFTVVLDVTAEGVATVTYTMDQPRAGATPIRVRWHEGINSGPSATEVSGVIPAGSTGPATLSVTALGCGGQIDMTAVFTTNGDSRGRVGGPLISIGTCAAPTPTGTSPAPATTAPAAVVPSSTAPTAGALVLAATATSQPAGGLPATGGGMSPAAAGAVALVIGGMLVFLTRRRLPFRSSE
jgi:hypothetical protein